MARQKIFISSAQSEFPQERSQIADYIRKDTLLSLYFEPFLFEELPAQDISAQNAFLSQVENSEIYLLPIEQKYGYQDAEGISPTEHEYNTATANHTYRIAFVKHTREEKEETKQELENRGDHVSDHVKILIKIIKGDTKTREEIMELMSIKSRRYFRENYMKPAIENGFVARLYPNALRRTDQAYYLTTKGLELLHELEKDKSQS